MDKFWKIVAVVVVAVVVVVESQEHRPLVLSGQDGGSNCYSSSTENGYFEALCARMHLWPQHFIIVKIIWVFLSYLFHRNLQKVLFLYKLSLKVAKIEILQKPSILKVIFSKTLQKGSIWRLNAQKIIQKPSTWRLNAKKTFKNLRPEDWMLKKPSKTFDLKVQTFAQV